MTAWLRRDMGAPSECCRGWCRCVSKPLMFIGRYSGVWSRTLLLPSPPARRNPNNYLRANVGGGSYLQPIAFKHDGMAAIAHGIAHFFQDGEESSLRRWIHLDGLLKLTEKRNWTFFICCCRLYFQAAVGSLLQQISPYYSFWTFVYFALLCTWDTISTTLVMGSVCILLAL